MNPITPNLNKQAPSKYSFVWKLFISLALSLGIGFIASLATQSSINTWYLTLNKPSFNPPNWVFAPVWTLLYVMMSVAAAIIWQKGLSQNSVKIALGLFLAQLFFNGLWSVAFFGLQSPLLGLLDISLLFIILIFTIIYFFRLSRLAGLMLLPYLLWLSFAAILNYTIWIIN